MRLRDIDPFNHRCSPGDSKSNDTRYADIREGAQIDKAQMADWVKQAAELPALLGPRS